ncbi:MULTISPECIES: class I adenylate-forming enzyme family protein [unclassified Nocardioides]|uniref:class I adenylate-forming enzyme family protein n=1 Tax=unclassified Nocardioides TaxID=2615069 RepID=UPI0007027036|nr:MULTISPECIES: AMP-binding protein [unclassified Nocardioides]KRC53787.1 acyl-CoA synthetase [Nocardioides sp. Root79]KRC71122.1 acyl-CoA synthetase [Nocardioides sp. Root240]
MTAELQDAWPGRLPRTLDYPAVPVGELLRGACSRYGQRTALHHGDDGLTYTQLWEKACAFAQSLVARGIGRGDTVTLHMPNCLEYAVAYYGTLLSGATFSPANPLLPSAPLVKQLADAGTVAVVTHARSAVAARDAVNDHVRLIVVVDGEPSAGEVSFESMVAESAAEPPPVGFDVAGNLAHISYTGGTTGLSKGVELTHANVVSNVLQYVGWNHGAVPFVSVDGRVTVDQIGDSADWPVRLGTGVIINLTPWFHAMGCIGSLTVPLVAGVSIVLHDRFDPAAYLEDAERWRVSSMSGAPAMFAALIAEPTFITRDLGSVRALSSGGGPLPHDHLRLLTERFPDVVVCEGYGLTEATMGVASNPTARSATQKPGTVGLPVFDTELRLVDPTTGEPSAPGRAGEVCVRGPQVMRGYRNRPQETVETLKDGWLHTGDMGVFDSDGYLTIVDRLKDMLIYKGYNVYPREIEELLIAQPSVRAAAVVGRPDAEVGERPVAFVVPNGEFDAEEVTAAVNEQLLPYKRIREVVVVDQIPVSAAGKVLKRDLRDQLT